MNGVQVDLLEHLLVGDLRLGRCGHVCSKFVLGAIFVRLEIHFGINGSSALGFVWRDAEGRRELDVAVMMADASGWFCRPTPRLTSGEAPGSSYAATVDPIKASLSQKDRTEMVC